VGVVPNPPKGSRLANSPIVYVPAKGK
jgi:hypothetical protein